MSTYHWKDGWHFRREDDGSVSVLRDSDDGEGRILAANIPANEWASIVHAVARWPADFYRIKAAIAEGATERREGVCMSCGVEYPVWFAPNPLWNRVVRRPDGSDEWDFLCPTCFANIAVARGVRAIFELREAEYKPAGASERADMLARKAT